MIFILLAGKTDIIMEIYYVSLSAANCKYKLQINDFLLLRENTGYQISTDLSFNQLIIKPNIILNIELLPIENQQFLTEIVSFECIIFSKSKGTESKNILYEYKFTDSNKNLTQSIFQKIITIPGLKYTPVWDTGEQLGIDQKTLYELYIVYQKLWNALKTKDINLLKELISLREETYAFSYGNTLEERTEFSIATYRSHLSDPDFFLFDFKPDSFKPKLHCFGKVISLEDEEGFQPVFFLKRDKQEVINIPAFYSKIKGVFRIVL
jgi:hypothetical protein